MHTSMPPPEQAPEIAGPSHARRNTALTLLSILAIIFLLRYAQAVFVPIALAVLISFALNPFVTLLCRLRVPRALSAAIVLLVVLMGTGYGVYALRHQALEAVENLPDVARELRRQIRQVRGTPGNAGPIEKIREAASEIEKAADEVAVSPEKPRAVAVQDSGLRVDEYLRAGSMRLIAVLSQGVMVVFLVFFLLSSGDLFKRKFVRLSGNSISEKRVTLEGLNEINAQVQRFLLTRIFTSALVGVATAVALWAFGVRQPAFWGLAAGVFNSIPYVGPFIATVGVAIVALLQFGAVSTALAVGGTAMLITGLEGFLLTPALMGKIARINGVSMFVSLIFWSWLWGAIGMVVAIPIMMVVKSACDRIEGLQPIGELLGER
ncbi:MAG: AI-2E family transporter [Bryobacteraceae bacterium]|nr:AI-2E family transporter [Bryobacteraceae bacterium]